MLTIDLLVPYYTYFHNFQRLPSATNFKQYYWFPLWLFKKDIKKLGVKIRFLDFFNLKYTKLSKIFGICSHNQRIHNNLVLFLKNLKRKVDYLIYFDQSDSTTRNEFFILKYVDKYFKRQLLKDRTLYNNKYYRNRIWVDYYIRNYNLNADKFNPGGYPIDPKFQDKIGLSWNWAYCDYRYSGLLSQTLYTLTKSNNIRYEYPSRNRELLFSANFHIHRGTELIYYLRSSLAKFLMKKYGNSKNVSIGHVSKKKYIKNMRISQAIFSPYGWGEICLRDFETYAGGAALIKPDMEHLVTWPDIYKKNETYFSLPWKMEEWENAISEILSDEDKLLMIAKNGQKAFKKLWTKEGKEEFCKRFVKMVTPD